MVGLFGKSCSECERQRKVLLIVGAMSESSIIPNQFAVYTQPREAFTLILLVALSVLFSIMLCFCDLDSLLLQQHINLE